MKAKSILFVAISISMIMLSTAVLILVIHFVTTDTSPKQTNTQVIQLTGAPIIATISSGTFAPLPSIELYWSTPPDYFPGGYFPTITPSEN